MVAAVWKPAVPNGFASRRYNLTDDGKYESPLCSERYKYPLRAYPSLYNKFKQSVLFKHQSQVTGEKKKRAKKISSSNTARQVIHCKGTQHNTIPHHSFAFSSYILCYGFWVLVRWLSDGFLSILIFCRCLIYFVLIISILNAIPCFVVTWKKKQYMGSFYLLNIVYVVSSFMLYVISGRQYN